MLIVPMSLRMSMWIGNELSAQFWLSPVALARNFGFNTNEPNLLYAIINRHQEELLEAWNGYFGAGRG